MYCCAVVLALLPMLAWALLGWLAGGLVRSPGELRSAWWWVVVGLPTLAVLFVGVGFLLVVSGIVSEKGWWGRLLRTYEVIGTRMLDTVRGLAEGIGAGLAALVPPLAPWLLGVR